MNSRQEESLKNLKRMVGYYESIIKAYPNHSFKTEYEICKEIVDFVLLKLPDKDFDYFQREDMEYIVNTFNKIDENASYCGST